MKITREELQAIENHMSNIPAVAGMYTPVLIAWCHALLDKHDDAYRRGTEAGRGELLDERDAALREVAGAKRALADYDRACAQVSSLTVENAELKARITTLEAMNP